MERAVTLQAKYERVAEYLSNTDRGLQIGKGEALDYPMPVFFKDIDAACRDLDFDMVNLVSLRDHLNSPEITTDTVIGRAISSACTEVLNLSIIHRD